MLDITETDLGFEVKFTYRQWIVDAIKQIPGSRYLGPTLKSWMVPKESETALFNWAQRFNNTKPVTKSSGIGEIDPMPDLTIDVPLRMPMFPFQAQGVAYNLIHKRNIIGDDPGLGKTVQAIASSIAANRKCTLIICPNTLKENWKTEIEKKWSTRKAIILSEKCKNTWPAFIDVGMAQYIICNYESLKKYFVDHIDVHLDAEGNKKPLRLNHIHFKETVKLIDCVIIDEAHKCKDGKTQQAKFVMGIARGKEYVWPITGTALVNKPADLIPILHIMNRLEEFGNYKGFVNMYCQGMAQASNLQHLRYMLHKHCFYRRRKKDVLKDLPDKLRTVVTCEISNQDEYNKAEADLAKYMKENMGKSDDEISISMRGELMVKFGVLKKIAARGKLEQVIEYVKEINDAGEKMIMFAWHIDVVKDLYKNLPGSLTIIGEDSLEARNSNIYSFQRCKKCGVKHEDHKNLDHDHEPSDIKNMICNIAAGGVGITLTASSRVGFIEEPWHPAGQEQCEDRVHRIGQKECVESTHFVGVGTVDEYIYDIIEAKRTITNQVLNGDTPPDAVEMDVVKELFNKFKTKFNFE